MKRLMTIVAVFCLLVTTMISTQAASAHPTVLQDSNSLVSAAATYYSLQIVHSGKCVDIKGQSQDDGAPVIQWYCTGRTNQQWSINQLGSGYVELRARHSGKCLDIKGGSIQTGANAIQWPCTGGLNQQWSLTYVNGVYELRARHSGLCLSVKDGNLSDGADLVQAPCISLGSQRFRLAYPQ